MVPLKLERNVSVPLGSRRPHSLMKYSPFTLTAIAVALLVDSLTRTVWDAGSAAKLGAGSAESMNANMHSASAAFLIPLLNTVKPLISPKTGDFYYSIMHARVAHAVIFSSCL